MKTVVLLMVTALMMPSVVFADNGKVSLNEAVHMALERNHLLKAAVYERSAAEREISISRSRYFPHIYLDETASVSNAPTRVFMMKLDQGRFSQNDFEIPNLNHPSAHGDFRTAFTLEQPLLDFSIGSGREMAEKEFSARDFALERRRQEVAYKVFSAYLDVQKSKAYVKVAEQAVADAREHERLAKVRNEAGVGLKSDELRARTFLSEAEQQSITAKNDRLLAGLRLAQVVGGEAGESLDISEEVKAPDVTTGNGELMRVALQNRPDLKEVEAGMGKAAVGITIARNAYLPTIYGSATYQMNDRDIPFGRDNDAWMVGANLRWELFDGMRRRSETSKAQLMKNAASEYLENYRKEIALQVEEGALRREEAGKRLEVARHALLDAEESVRLISRRFENSLMTMVELLDAQTALNRARAQLVENESSYAQATARLFHAAGIFLKEVYK
ncbi:MAG: outer membrane efflux [Geobacteraceae bacterium]|nr:MAG: outer membrane efflux [Geobacteraceae bacterium]